MDLKYNIESLILLTNELMATVKFVNEEVMKIYRSDFEVMHKQDDSPVTKADLTANKIICEALTRLTPNIPIISEESKEIDFEERKNLMYCWCIDPIDGTKEFVKKNDEFVVNIALIENGKPVLGIVSAPALGEISWAVKGGGAFLEKDGMTCRLACNKFAFDESGLRLARSRSHRDAQTMEYASRFNNPIWIKKGSALKMVMIAGNQADIYIRMGITMEWDIAAPQIILEEAGGAVLSFDSKQPLSYNKKDLQNEEFIAFGDCQDLWLLI